MMGNFFVIQVINKKNQRGYVIDSPEGVNISIGGVTRDVAQFPTHDAAKQFIRDNRIEKSGARAYVRTNEELIALKEPGLGTLENFPEKDNLVYLESSDGLKCMFNTKGDFYFFRKVDAGFCVWKEGANDPKLQAMVKEFEESTGLTISIKKMSDLPKK